jgi:hypothetical protein
MPLVDTPLMRAADRTMTIHFSFTVPVYRYTGSYDATVALFFAMCGLNILIGISGTRVAVKFPHSNI